MASYVIKTNALGQPHKMPMRKKTLIFVCQCVIKCGMIIQFIMRKISVVFMCVPFSGTELLKPLEFPK